MRLLTVTLRNYRLHRELKVSLDPARTLIGGSNESGKSTLVEAIHRALFLKAKGNTELHRAMTSSLHAGHPEVELVFEARGRTFVLKKRFGPAGTTTLAPADSPAISGEAAETELARILGVDAGVTGRAMTTQWAHLWVWQGQAADDPSAHATAQREGLLQRLQNLGGAAALQSERDSRVARHFATVHDQIFTQAGKPKAGSALEIAERTLALSREEFTRAQGRLLQLESAAVALEDGTRALQATALHLGELERQQEALELRTREWTILQQQEAAQIHTANVAGERLAARVQADQRISAVRTELQALEGTLAPQQVAVAEAAVARDGARVAAVRAEATQREAAEAVRQARLRHELAVAHAVQLERAERHARLRDKTAHADRRRQEVTQFEEQLARLPILTTARLRKLQERESENAQSYAALQAMATGLEVVAADGEVRVGAQILQPGQRHIVTDDTEVSLGSKFRLRLQPGGGTSLADARQVAAEARQVLQKDLDSLGLASLTEALEIHARREEFAARLKEARAELDGLGADKLGEELLQAQHELTAATASVHRLAGLAPEVPAPQDLMSAHELAKSLAGQRTAAEAREIEARSSREQIAKQMESAEETWQRRQLAMEQATVRLTGLKAQLELLYQTHGDDLTRAQALLEARTAHAAARQVLQATAAALAALQPELLEADRLRIRRALEQKQNERNEARTQIAVAQAALRSDGTEDPRAAVTLADARVRSARAHAQSVRRKADAVALLDQWFREEQRTLAGQFTQPLADKISGYLQCIFGPGTRAGVTYEDSGFTGLQLSRGASGGATFAFDTLSGGAREQTAAAVRLAMAEVLAGEHDGCLPVVFDDAFAYSDPDRVHQLQRMLDLAASRGLQLIVLTCNPADYAALGARTVTLRTERFTPQSVEAFPEGPALASETELAKPLGARLSSAIARVPKE